MSNNAKKENKDRKFLNPNGYFIIMILILLAAIATWVIPAGQYDRVVDSVTGREVVDPNSFRYIEKTPVGLFDAIVAIPLGIKSMSGIIAFIFIVAGATALVKSTGAIDAGLVALVDKFKGRDLPLLIATIIICSLLGSLLGFAQEIIPFIPLGVALALSLGYDKVVGFDIVRTSTWVGFAASTINPYVVVVAQQMAGLPIMSGLRYRIIIYFIFMIISTIFFLNYAKRVRDNKQNSVIFGYESGEDQSKFKIKNITEFTIKHKIILITFACGLILSVYGVQAYEWGTNEMAAVILITGIIAGFIAGYSPNLIAKIFTGGMSEITSGALIAGFTGAIAIILQQGQILDTIIYGLSQPLSQVNGAITV